MDFSFRQGATTDQYLPRCSQIVYEHPKCVQDRYIARRTGGIGKGETVGGPKKLVYRPQKPNYKPASDSDRAVRREMKFLTFPF